MSWSLDEARVELTGTVVAAAPRSLVRLLDGSDGWARRGTTG